MIDLDDVQPGEIETRLALEYTKLAASVLLPHETALRELIEKADRFGSAGFVLDPTLYMRTLHDKRFKSNIQAARDTITWLSAMRRWCEAHGVAPEELADAASYNRQVEDELEDQP